MSASIDSAILGRYRGKAADGSSETFEVKSIDDSSVEIRQGTRSGTFASLTGQSTGSVVVLVGQFEGEGKDVVLVFTKGVTGDVSLRGGLLAEVGSKAVLTFPSGWTAPPGGGLVDEPTRPVEPGTEYNQVFAIATTGKATIAGGVFGQTADGSVKGLGNIAYWDGSTESPTPLSNGGLNGTVYAIAAVGDSLYFGGLATCCTRAGCSRARPPARRRGSTTSPPIR